ncbi:Cof-type HAD-IIB family hydrolase [Paenibacillus sediminis]|uniref:Cof subfamily protein (Haloacid dehalogenase superfamily) n=1 Tax=Paenibacillus sediminis TaxID=664909 RepID=A0ABS4H4I8_9BACL|nr:Cof-type HAD-IIB family hydrolase [Paenibacillus sediminis]MBP1937453.1 Cof subfamily protein (haloacid dehalogenase superfamily) [Paenibacillus sediminis]
MYKLIAIDIDDTLINDHMEVTEATSRALQEATDKGVVVTLATGRMYASAQAIARQTGLNVPIITYQGALIKNLLDEKVLYERFVPINAARKLLEYCKEHNLHVQLYVNDRLHALEENEKLIAYANASKIPYIIDQDFDALIEEPTYKMLIIDEPERLDEIAPILRDLLGSEVHITKSKPQYLEIMHREGTKGDALTFLAKHYNCHLSEVIAIGDSWNDHEMIEAAGLGVAMGNAVDSLKEIADYVTLTNNEEGVKHVIDKFILQKAE